VLKVGGRYKLADFGVSKSMDISNNENIEHTLSGSPPFLSPKLRNALEKK